MYSGDSIVVHGSSYKIMGRSIKMRWLDEAIGGRIFGREALVASELIERLRRLLLSETRNRTTSGHLAAPDGFQRRVERCREAR